MRHGMGIERELDERQAMVATEAIFLRLSKVSLNCKDGIFPSER